MTVELTKEYRFEAAHSLPRVPEGHKCARLHGHSYKIELEARGAVNGDSGWLVDFGVLDEAWAAMHALFDHRCLNDVPGLENPTSENLAVYIWNQLRPRVPALSAITVWEIADAKCTYRGP